jgi:succinate dehydrogenase / fumarate reductase membrane anchor subunit
MSLRSPLGRVLGTGSAKDGTGHWWAERVTSVALVPLTLWLFFSLLGLPALEYAPVRNWLAQPINAFAAVLTVAVAGYHAHLGTTVVVEDYVHVQGAKLAALLLLRFLFVLFGGAAVFAILRIAFGP